MHRPTSDGCSWINARACWKNEPKPKRRTTRRKPAEAEAHAAEDEASKAKVEARNELDNIVYQAEKQTKELGDKIPADKKTELEAAIAEGLLMIPGNIFSRADSHFRISYAAPDAAFSISGVMFFFRMVPAPP